jgi:hypothetical protein
MSDISYGKLLEDRIKEIFEERFGVKVNGKSDWLIKQIEALINQYPNLEQLDIYRLTLSEILSAIENYCDGAKASYDEKYDVLIIEPVVEDNFFTRKNLLLLFLFCAFGGISLFNLKVSHKCIDNTSYQNSGDFDDFIYNSKIINHLDKKTYHIITSVYSIFNFIYFLQDEKLNAYFSKATKEGAYKSLSLAEYIKIKDEQRKINDPLLNLYIINLIKFKNNYGSPTNKPN